MKYILIDADTGIDDSIAILFALKRKDVRVVGITTGFGNTNARQAADNSLRLIQLSGVDYEVPVAVGATGPLVGEWEGPVPHIHGHNGIGDAQIPASSQQPLEEAACDFIIRMAKEYEGKLTLVTLGRMTNLALALQKEPELPRLVKNVVFMGGTYHAPGNVTPVAEANIAGDPEAADQVLQAGFDITMVGLDVTQKVRLTAEHIEKLDKYAAPENRTIVDYLKQAMPLYFRFNRQQNNCLDHCPVHDPMAMLTVVDPSLVTTRRMPARVECGGNFCRGMVVTDLREYPMDAQYLNICVDVDGRKAVEELLTTFMD